MADKDHIYTKKSRKTGLSILSIILIVLTVFLGAKGGAGYMEKLTEFGLKDALTGYVPVLALAAVSVLVSLCFLFSSWRAKRIARKKMIKLAEQAEEAKAKGIEFKMPEKSAGAKVGSAISNALGAFTKILILLFILALAGSAGYTAMKDHEFRNRPTFDVLQAVDISNCVTGYEGLGYVELDNVTYDLPEDVTEILKTSKNYRETGDYKAQQELWTKFLNDLQYTITPDTSEGGTLSNGDNITVSTSLPGYDVPKLQADLGIMFEGIDNSKDQVVSGLLVKYSDVDTLLAEKSDLIKAAYDMLKKESYKMHDSFKSSSLSGFTFDKVYLCKPQHDEALNPDALLMLAYTNVDADTEYSSMHTMAIYIFPLSSETQPSDVTDKPSYDPDQVACRIEFFNYNTPDKVKTSFETGIYFSAATGYDLIEVPWTVPVTE